MLASVRCRPAVLVLLAVVAAPVGAGSSEAQPVRCPTDSVVNAVVDVRMPLPGDRVSGDSVVAGTVRASALLTKVELYVNDTLAGSQTFAAALVHDFAFRWDAGRFPAGASYLTVVGCGDLASGNATVGVRVKARRPVWVGVVVGASGLVGLALSLPFRRARGEEPGVDAGGSVVKR